MTDTFGVVTTMPIVVLNSSADCREWWPACTCGWIGSSVVRATASDDDTWRAYDCASQLAAEHYEATGHRLAWLQD